LTPISYIVPQNRSKFDPIYHSASETILQGWKGPNGVVSRECILLMEAFKMEKRSLAQLFDLTGKASIVTGGAMGIGQATALRLAEAGAAVMIADLNLEAALETVEQIVSTGGKAAVLQADASSVSDATKVAQMTVATFGTVDILVNNAAARSIAPILDLSEAQWERVINTDLKGVFFYAQAAAREMIKGQRGGRIVNIASVNAFHPSGMRAHYDASKGGVVTLTKSLALELGKAPNHRECSCSWRDQHSWRARLMGLACS
jgi:short-subunit dehydrogenase